MNQLKGYTNGYKFYITVSIAVLCMITTLISVGFGALNKNLNIAGDIDYEKGFKNTIKSWGDYSTTEFHDYTYSGYIKTVDFLSNKNIPANAIESWDVSVNSDGKVMAWIVDDPNNEGTYKLYIGANGGVDANPDSSNLFAGLYVLETVNFNNSFDTSEVTNMSYMFSITSIMNIDFEGFDTSNVTNMSHMFGTVDDFTPFMDKTLDLSSFNTSKVTDMSSMFEYCRFSELIIDNFDTSNVKDMSFMFLGCNDLTELNLTNFNTSKVESMYGMFEGCHNLTNLDVTPLNTNNVTNMRAMFSSCYFLTNLNVTNFNTNNVTDMSSMFNNCSSLTNLNVTNFNTSNVTNMSYMFASCNNLTNIDVTHFNTNNVTNMSYMFSSCFDLTSLDLTSFNTSNVTDMTYMFCGNSLNQTMSLNNIYISSKWNVSNVTSSSRMFYKCTSLPNFNSSYITKTKAIPTFSGGYLTLDMEGKYFSITPDSNSYTISNSITGYSSNQTINPSELTKWRVIASNRTGNLELVSDTISSTKIYFSGVTGYANLVSGLQTIASQYAKSGKTSSVRCMGYDGQTGTISPTTAFNGSTNSPPSTSSTPSPTTGTGQEYGSGVQGDTLYLKDYLLVKNVYGDLKANTVGTSTPSTYWLASRRYDYYSNTNYGFFGRTINEGGELVTYNRLRHYFDGWIDTNSNFAIRPIMTLNNNITITGGSGTLSDPYTIS